MTNRFSISIKGVVLFNDKIVLLKNEREEWELPGGRIELDETPQETVKREIKEELNLDVVVGDIIDAWMYDIGNKGNVFIVSYMCKLSEENVSNIQISDEHKEIGWFDINEIDNISLPKGYVSTIKKACLVRS